MRLTAVRTAPVQAIEPAHRFVLAWERVCAEMEVRRWRAEGQRASSDLPLPPADSQRSLVEHLARLLRGSPALVEPQPFGCREIAVRTRQGDPDRAQPGALWLSTPDAEQPPVVARVRWLPPNLYRAMGFVLKLEEDCRHLQRDVQAGRAAATFVCFVDCVGAVLPERVAGWRDRYPLVSVLGWSARWGGVC